MAIRYPIGDYMEQMGALLNISPQRVLSRAGLSPSLANTSELSVGADGFFRIWDAMRAEANRPGIEMDLAMAYAHGPFIPPIFAFSCAETLGLGLSRLSDFKPLIGPIRMTVERRDNALVVSLSSAEIGFAPSPSMGLFELLYITECARTFTGTQVTPIETSLPGHYDLHDACVTYLGRHPKIAGCVSLTFSGKDADLPLITRSASLWETLEPGFLDDLQQRQGIATTSGQVKSELLEALPGGSTTVGAIARRLNLSKRSLQRRLTDEGTSFQKLLDGTRFQMSVRYLEDTRLSMPEISHLLGFRETSSFFRAFQGWTGKTPGHFRAARSANGGR